MLEQAQLYHYGQKIALKMPTKIRWGTHHCLLSGVVRSRDSILQVVRDPLLKSKASLVVELNRLNQEFSDNQMSQKLRELESILRPLVNAIKLIEGDIIDRAEAYIRVIEAFDMALEQVTHSMNFAENVCTEMKEVKFC